MDTEKIKQLAIDVNNVASASFNSGKEHTERPLLAKIKQLQSANKQFEEILDRYAWHKKDCMLFSIAEHPHCTCGYEQALAKIKDIAVNLER